MVIEIRKVPKDWKHPRDKNGKFKPMFGEAYEDELKYWMRNHRLWNKGRHIVQKYYPERIPGYKYYAQFEGDPPKVGNYNPNKWDEKEACCFQVYEINSYGTPISPIFEALDALEHWMVKSQGYPKAVFEVLCNKCFAHIYPEQLHIQPGHKVSMKADPVKKAPKQKKGRRL